MRVRISTNPPLPPLKAWLPLSQERTQTISAFKFLLSTSIPAFRGSAPSSLHLTLDGFELLDSSEISVVRDGDLIHVDVQEVCSSESTTAGQSRAVKSPSLAGHKRKRRMSTSTPGFESDAESTTSESESESDTETSDSESESDSDDSSLPTTPSLQKVVVPQKVHAQGRVQTAPLVQQKPTAPHPTKFVPPGYGKAQTRSRNLRRRRKRMYEREAADESEGGPVSGANAVLPGEKTQVEPTMDDNPDGYTMLALPSLSLRNKNKARNFKALMGKPLPPKIIFGDEEGVTSENATPKVQTPSARPVPRFTPPSSLTSLPPNMFVTSIDVEAGMHREKKKRKMRIDYEDKDITLDYGNETSQPTSKMDIDKLESVAEKNWAALERPVREKQLTPGTMVGYKALGINPVTYTPEQLLTVGRVESCDSDTVVVRRLREREQVSFSGPVDDDSVAVQEEERHTWAEIEIADWRVLT